jgi:zinc protease
MSVELRTTDGIRWIHAEDPDLGIVFAEVVVEAGSLLDPEGREGLANLTVNTLLRGTPTRSYRELMDDLNDRGAGLETSTQKEFVALNSDFMPRFREDWLDLIADVLANPTFPDDEFQHERALVLEDLRSLRNDDGELARHFFARFLYRNHPLGRPTDGYISSVGRLGREDCAAFHAGNFHRGNLVMVLAGSIDASKAEDVVRTFASRLPPGNRAPVVLPPPPASSGRRVLIVDKPDRTQTQVILGHPTLSWTDPDLFPLLVGNTAFGGTFTSRLVREIREERGWSYGAGSSITAGGTFGTFGARFFPATRDTAPAIRLTLDLMEEVAAKGISQDEVEFAKEHLINQFPFRIETVRKRADERLADEVYGRPGDFLARYVYGVGAQTVDTVAGALRRWFLPDSATIVVVGTAALVEAELARIPGVTSVEVVPYTSDSLDG